MPTTISNMNMSPNNMNSSTLKLKRADFTTGRLTLPTRVPAKTAAAINPLHKLLSHSRTKKSPESQIDEALGIISSPDSTSSKTSTNGGGGSVNRRRCSFHKSGSSLSVQRAGELLSDNSDRLTELMRTCSNNMEDSDSDDESDLED